MATLDLYLNMPLRRLNRVAYSHLLDLIQPSPVARLFLAVAYRLTGLRPAVFWNLAAILVTSAASVPSLSHVRRGYSADHFLNHLQISVMAISSMTSGEEVLAWPIDVVLVAAVRSGGRRRNVAGTLGDMWNSFQIDAKRALRDETFPTSWHLEHAIFAAVLFEYGTLVLLGIPEAEAMRAAEIMAPLHLAARGIFHVPGDIALHRSHYTVDKLMEADVNPTWAGRCRTWEAIGTTNHLLALFGAKSYPYKLSGSPPHPIRVSRRSGPSRARMPGSFAPAFASPTVASAGKSTSWSRQQPAGHSTARRAFKVHKDGLPGRRGNCTFMRLPLLISVIFILHSSWKRLLNR